MVTCLKFNLKNDQLRWGDTWKKGSHSGQTERILKRIGEYIDDYYRRVSPFPG